jgi:thiazole/oxazole-forming peptide maturase SagD family component
MDGGFELVSREYTKAGFSVNDQTKTQLIGERLFGYGFLKFSSLFGSWFFKVKRAAHYIVPLDYNPEYLALVEELTKKGFVTSLSVRGMYHDYPKVISYKIMGAGRGNGDERGTFASSMVFPERGHDVALSKALGELLERDAARYRPREDAYFPKTRKKPLPFAYEDIPHFSKQQQNHSTQYVTAEDADALYESVKVKNISTGASTYLPIQYVYYGSRPGWGESEKILVESTTNGCGGGFTKEQAAISALCEFIERDHFMLWWFSGCAPRRISLTGATTLLAKKVEEAHTRYGLEVYFLNTSYDVSISSVVCIVIDPVLHVVGMGGKAGIYEDILEGAYVEALTLLHSTRARIEGGTRGDAFFKPNDFTDMSMHQAERETQCCTPAAIDYIKKTFLAGDTQTYVDFMARCVPVMSETALFAELVRRCESRTHDQNPAEDIYMYEFDSPWLRECDYHAVRVCIPAFLKLHLREGYATPVSKRLKRFCEDHAVDYSESTVNRIPHFFP